MSKNIIQLVMVGLLFGTTHAGVAHANNAISTDQNTKNLPFFNLDESATSTGKLIVLEGDVLTGPKMTQRGMGVKKGSAVWKDGIVPYYIDPELQPFVVKSVEKAIKTWNRMAGISLVEINPGDANSPVDYIHFTPANGCASWIGRQGGAQAIWTAPSCSAGSMMHEIGHALGLEHEHTRPDRDQHIAINWDNIDPEKVENFSISDKEFYGEYDHASIMHYGEYFFSSTGGQTIRKINADGTASDIQIGQRIEPSKGDIAAIAKMYASDVTLVTNVVILSGQTEVTLLVTNEAEQGANDLAIKMTVGDAQMMSNTSDWDCATLEGVLECGRLRLEVAAQSKLVLILDRGITVDSLNAHLVTNSLNENLPSDKAAASLAGTDSPTLQPLADQQLEASAGSTGYLILSALMLLSFARKQL